MIRARFTFLHPAAMTLRQFRSPSTRFRKRHGLELSFLRREIIASATPSTFGRESGSLVMARSGQKLFWRKMPRASETHREKRLFSISRAAVQEMQIRKFKTRVREPF